MRTLLLFLAVFILPTLVIAQADFVKPDYKKIEAEIKNKESRMYYPTLFARYSKNDTTLTVEEYRHLYFGYFFQDSYSPYGSLIKGVDDSIRAIQAKEKRSKDDWRRLIDYSGQALSKGNPFSLRTVYDIAAAYSQLGDSLNTDIYAIKFTGLVAAILSTGDGRTEETAFHVNSTSDEYSILSVLDYSFGGTQSLTAKTCDYLTVEKNDNNIAGLYFDVNQLFESYKKVFGK